MLSFLLPMDDGWLGFALMPAAPGTGAEGYTAKTQGLERRKSN